jgi:hypothetical protein
MKYLITESQLDNTMEIFLKKSFPEVISVTSRPVNVYIADEQRSVTRTEVTVICDPNGYVVKNNSGMNDYDLRIEIRKSLHKYFNIDYGYINTQKLTLEPLIKF